MDGDFIFRGFVVFVVLLIGILIWSITSYCITENRYKAVLVSQGFKEEDLDAFQNVSDLTYADLVSSEPARMVLRKFINGELNTVKKTEHSTTVMPIVISR